MQQNFSCRNKFIIVHPCGLIVHNNAFLKMRVFISLTGYSDAGGGGLKKCVCCNNNNNNNTIEGNE